MLFKSLRKQLALGLLLLALSLSAIGEVVKPTKIFRWAGKDGKKYVMLVMYSSEHKHATMIKKIVAGNYIMLFYYIPEHEA